MQAGDVAVLVDDVDGVEAGREGQIMSVRDNMLMVGFRADILRGDRAYMEALPEDFPPFGRERTR